MNEWRYLPIRRRLHVLWVTLRGVRAMDTTDARFVAALARGLMSHGVTRGWVFLIFGVADLLIAAWLVLTAPTNTSPWRWIVVGALALIGLIQAGLPFTARRAARLNDSMVGPPE